MKSSKKQRADSYISDSFKSRADSAAFFEAWVGARLSRSNLYSVHHPFTVASETGNPVSFYAHTWDLDVSPDNKLFTPVEVKSVSLSFTEPNDYPHLGVLVCSESSYEKKWQKAEVLMRDFLLVSRNTGGIVWIPKGAPVTRREVTDKKRGETYWCKAVTKQCILSLADFVEVIQQTGDPWTEPGHAED